MPSPTERLAERLGVDLSTVEGILAESDQGEFTGYARCLTGGCEHFDEDREVGMVRTFAEQVNPDNRQVLGRSEHFHLVDDQDAKCPGCGSDCALLPEKRRTIPRLI